MRLLRRHVSREVLTRLQPLCSTADNKQLNTVLGKTVSSSLGTFQRGVGIIQTVHFLQKHNVTFRIELGDWALRFTYLAFYLLHFILCCITNVYCMTRYKDNKILYKNYGVKKIGSFFDFGCDLINYIEHSTNYSEQ